MATVFVYFLLKTLINLSVPNKIEFSNYLLFTIAYIYTCVSVFTEMLFEILLSIFKSFILM